MNQKFELDYHKLATKADSNTFQILDQVKLPEDPIITRNDQDTDYDDAKTSRRIQAIKRMKVKYAPLGGSMTSDWFNAINIGEIDDKVNFPESLLLVTESGSTVGKYYCSVKKSLLSGEPCLVVHAGSSGSMVNGLECGTSITGFVDYRMNTLHEIAHEWMKKGDKSAERKFLISYEDDKRQYYCKRLLRENGEITEEKQFALSANDMKNVITESANVIFQRIITIQRKTGEINLKSLNSKGKIVKTNFRTLGSGFEHIRGEEIRVYGVRRTVFDGSTIEEWDNIFNGFGRMVLRCQPERDHALIPLWFKSVEEYSSNGEVFIGTRPPLLWACDMELYAQYLERKERCASEYKDYLQRQTQLQAILSDFLQAILIKKPQKIIEFGMTFFEPFLKKHSEVKLSLSDMDSEAEEETVQDRYWEYDGEGAEVYGEGGLPDSKNYTAPPEHISTTLEMEIPGEGDQSDQNYYNNANETNNSEFYQDPNLYQNPNLYQDPNFYQGQDTVLYQDPNSNAGYYYDQGQQGQGGFENANNNYYDNSNSYNQNEFQQVEQQQGQGQGVQDPNDPNQYY